MNRKYREKLIKLFKEDEEEYWRQVKNLVKKIDRWISD